MYYYFARRAIAFTLTVMLTAAATAQLRVATWNVSNYSSGRVAAFQTSIYGEFEGRALAPDILIGQEYLSSTGVTNFLNLLNDAADSPGDWAASPFINGPDTDSAFFYRTSKVEFIGVTTVATGGVSPNHPRNIQRYDVKLVGYGEPGVYLACYSSHMKAGTSSSDQARRLLEAQRIRADAETLPEDWYFLLGGDFNIQSSSQDAYQELVGPQPDDAGRLFDPINTPGSWNNNSYYRYIHTQDPAGAGGMDDRHDQILVCDKLIGGGGFEYIGDPNTAYSTTSWYDPGHSYRCWGNDGTSYNTALTIAGNTMVGAVVAQALVNTTSQGHLPVYLDLRTPPRVDSPLLLDFGQVLVSEAAEADLLVVNAGDTDLWTEEGVADLEYSLTTTAGFNAPADVFAACAGQPGNLHLVEMDTAVAGVISGVLTIASNAPDDMAREVILSGVAVEVWCPGDLDADGDVDLSDLAQLLSNYGRSSLVAYADGDLDRNGQIDLADLAEMLSVYGCACQP